MCYSYRVDLPPASAASAASEWMSRESAEGVANARRSNARGAVGPEQEKHLPDLDVPVPLLSGAGLTANLPLGEMIGLRSTQAGGTATHSAPYPRRAPPLGALLSLCSVCVAQAGGGVLTLMKLITGQLYPSSGACTVPAHISTLLVGHEPVCPSLASPTPTVVTPPSHCAPSSPRCTALC